MKLLYELRVLKKCVLDTNRPIYEILNYFFTASTFP